MRSSILTGLLITVFTVGTAGAINCKQVNKYLEIGRSVKDVAETMVVSESDVKQCQEEAAEAKAAEAAGQAAGDTEKQ